MKLYRKYLPSEHEEKHRRGTIINLQKRQSNKFLNWTNKRALAMLTSGSPHTCSTTESANV